VVAWSIVPVLAQNVLSALGEAIRIPPWPIQPADELLLRSGRERLLVPIRPLITKLDAAAVARLSRRFAGDQPETS